MTHLDDDYKDAPFSSDFSQPSEPSGETPIFAENDGTNTVEDPTPDENPAPQERPVLQSVPTSAGSASRESADGNRATGQVYGDISEAVRSSFEEIARGMNQLNLKLMEFGRLTAENNFAFVQNIAGIRSVGSAVELQTAYLRSQYDTATTQLQELQALTTGIAEKAAAPIKQQLAQAAQPLRKG